MGFWKKRTETYEIQIFTVKSEGSACNVFYDVEDGNCFWDDGVFTVRVDNTSYYFPAENVVEIRQILECEDDDGY